MTKLEVGKLIKFNQTTFPNFYKDFSEKDSENMINLWFEFFKNYETKIIDFYFARALSTSKFPVVPADIFNQLNALKNSQEQSPDELWKVFLKAADEAADVAYDVLNLPGTDFEKSRAKIMQIYDELPAPIKTFVADSFELIKYGQAVDRELYIKPVFLKRIAEISKKQKIIRETPPEILSLFDNTLKQIEG